MTLHLEHHWSLVSVSDPIAEQLGLEHFIICFFRGAIIARWWKGKFKKVRPVTF